VTLQRNSVTAPGAVPARKVWKRGKCGAWLLSTRAKIRLLMQAASRIEGQREQGEPSIVLHIFRRRPPALPARAVVALTTPHDY
jgi:hypothetical protein